MTRIDAALLLAVLLSASCGSEERGEYEERAGTGSITKIGQSSTQVILWAESAAIEDLIDTSVFGGAELPTSITALEGKLGISERFLDPAGNSGARFKVGNAVLSAIEWRGPAGAPRMQEAQTILYAEPTRQSGKPLEWLRPAVRGQVVPRTGVWTMVIYAKDRHRLVATLDETTTQRLKWYLDW
jgi:hypothetical protein